METFSIEAMVRGYHVYQDIWNATVGEELYCQREPRNNRGIPCGEIVFYCWAYTQEDFVGMRHVFFQWGGTIQCRATTSRCYSGDLPQGGLEIPCILTFVGSPKYIGKISKLVRYTLSSSPGGVVMDHKPPVKKQKCGTHDEKTKGIISGDILSDIHINLAQQLLKQQFPHLNGHQVINCCTQDHWIVASTVRCKNGEVDVYDSVFSLDKETAGNLFHTSNLKVMESQKQEGCKDCELFAIANGTAIAFSVDLTTVTFDQAAMRCHLFQSFVDGVISLFPVL